MKPKTLSLLASILLFTLIALCLAWETVIAPLRPGGSWMTLKGILLLPPLFGILRGKRYTYKWLSLFIQLYLLEGLTRATSDHGLSQALAIGETLLATVLFVTCVLFVRSTRQSPPKPADTKN